MWRKLGADSRTGDAKGTLQKVAHKNRTNKEIRSGVRWTVPPQCATTRLETSAVSATDCFGTTKCFRKYGKRIVLTQLFPYYCWKLFPISCLRAWPNSPHGCGFLKRSNGRRGLGISWDIYPAGSTQTTHRVVPRWRPGVRTLIKGVSTKAEASVSWRVEIRRVDHEKIVRNSLRFMVINGA